MGINLGNLAERLRLTLVLSRKEAFPKSPEELAEESFRGGVGALQLREKTLTGLEHYELAMALAKLCREHGRLFIVNDRLDLALASEADGLHLGQSDLPAKAAARFWPKSKILGISVSTVAEARAALEAGADYLGVGALFPTDSKTEAAVVPWEIVTDIVSLGAPTVGIGGISISNAKSAWKLGLSGLAVISALTRSNDPFDTAIRLLERD